MAAGDETVALTSDSRGTSYRKKHEDVWELVLTSTHDVDDTDDVTQAVNINGILRRIVFVIPDSTSGCTGQLVIKDNSDNTIWDSGEKADDDTYDYHVDEYLSGEIDIVMGINKAAGTNGIEMIAYLSGV